MPPLVSHRRVRPSVRRSVVPFPPAARTKTMTFGTFSSSLGTLLIAASARGISFVAFGDSALELKQALRAEFPRASITEDASQVVAWARSIEAMLRGVESRGSLPTDTSGTDFQELVWEQLRRIPRGERCTYQELAVRIGKPKAVRAVAQACATNNVAVIVPCHRVVRTDGALGGYRWGVRRKEALLSIERAVTETQRARRT